MMRPVLSATLGLLVVAPALLALDEPSQKGKTPRERYQALFQEYQNAMQQFMDVYQKAKTQEERSKLVQEKYPQPQSYVGRFFEIADSAPKDEAAVDALIWVVQHGGSGAQVNRAIERLAASHADNRRIGEVAGNLVYSMAPSAETLLRAIVAKSPDREAKGRSCLALGQYLKRQAELVRTLKTDPARAKQTESAYAAQGVDKESFARLSQRDPAGLEKESEAMFERAANEFGDVNHFRGTIGKAAKAELNELHNLAIGKPVPEISGEDIDGKSFKLSDYRGKVVVVDFWGDW
jgi:hypothetical protein